MEHPETSHQDVRAVVSVDERGVMAVDGRRPYELRDFGQDAAIASLLRYATVVMGVPSAQSYGGRPPGACIIVLTSPSRALPLANVWKGAIVVHSVQEVLRVSRGTPLYVLGGVRIHALFAPHVRAVYRFVYEGASLDTRGAPVVYFPIHLYRLLDNVVRWPTCRVRGNAYRVNVSRTRADFGRHAPCAALDVIGLSRTLPEDPISHTPHTVTTAANANAGSTEHVHVARAPHKHLVCAPRKHRHFVAAPPKKAVFLDDPADMEQALIQSFYDHASRADQAYTADAEDDGAGWCDSDADLSTFSSSDNETDFELEAHDDNESKNKCRELNDHAAVKAPIVDEPPCFVGACENGEHVVSLAGEHEALLLHTPGMGAVVMASSWLQRSERHPERTLYDYGRGAGPNHDALATSLRRIYPTAQSVDLFCSGTAAIAGIIDAAIASDIDGDDESDTAAACSAESVVIVHKELYGGTERLLEHLAATRRGFTFAIADLNDPEWVDQEVTAVALRGARVCLFYAESCSNPSGYVLDTRALAALRDRLLTHVPIVVDNSWLSMLCNPLAQGADAIVESLTKHVGSGHLVAGMAAFGATLPGAALAQRTRRHAEATGQHVSPFDAWLAESNVTTLAWRIDIASACCLAAARFLEAHPCVERVIYPGLASHPDAAIARRVMRTRANGDLVGPTVLLFCVRLDAAAATRMIDSSPLLCYASSYGKPWPLFDPHVAEGAADYYDTRAYDDEHAAEPCSWVRLAAGYSVAAHALVAELDRLLRAHVAKRSL